MGHQMSVLQAWQWPASTELAADVGELGAQFCARGREGGGAVGLALPDRLAAVRR
jgi:hypothetical protein